MAKNQRNPVAKKLGSRLFRPRVVKSKKLYNRKEKPWLKNQ